MTVNTAPRVTRRARNRGLAFLVPEHPVQWIGLSIIVLWVLLAVTAPLIAPYGPLDTTAGPLLGPPTAQNWLGTDQLGRDILSRLLFGAQITLPIGVITVALALLIGVPWGIIAGYFGGPADQILMRLADLVLAFPSLVLALAIAGSLGAGPQAAVVGVAIALIPRYARLVRGEVLSLREREFVLADKGFGASAYSTLLRVVLPNAMRPVASVAILDTGIATVAAATLSFLGLGVPPPFPEWGAMTSIGLAYPSQWWLTVPSGLCLVSFILAINLYANRSAKGATKWRKLR